LIAAQRIGTKGRVVGIDFSEAIFRELARVVRPGGCVFGAELVREPSASLHDSVRR
jgi:ubiquinone/menaquinone biosynthesis C-methylase UbiE